MEGTLTVASSPDPDSTTPDAPASPVGKTSDTERAATANSALLLPQTELLSLFTAKEAITDVAGWAACFLTAEIQRDS